MARAILGYKQWLEAHFFGRFFLCCCWQAVPVIRSGFRCPRPIPLTTVLTSPNSGQFPILSPGHQKSLLQKVLRASPLGRSLKGFLYTTTTATNPPAGVSQCRKAKSLPRKADSLTRRGMGSDEEKQTFSLFNVAMDHTPDGGLRSGSEKGRVRSSPADGK